MIDITKVEYLAFEGGGGKGTIYEAPFKVLAELGVLPVRGENKQIKGVAGASAGAITALTIALGMSVDDINKETNNAVNYSFYDEKKLPKELWPHLDAEKYPGPKGQGIGGFKFADMFGYDPPEFGSYRGVRVNADGSTDIGFAYDEPYSANQGKNAGAIRKKEIAEFRSYGFTDTQIKEVFDKRKRKDFKNLENGQIKVGIFSPTRRQEKDGPEQIIRDFHIKNFYSPIVDIKNPFELLTKGGVVKRRMRSFIKKAQKETPSDPLLNTLWNKNNKDEFIEYIYNEMFERGLFPGYVIRKYYRSLMYRMMMQYHEEGFRRLGPAKMKDPEKLTFKDFFEITGVDLKIGVVNMTAGEVVMFSKDDTPDFSVTESVGMSMSIPLFFKPVFVDADAVAGKSVIKTGLYVDGGTLLNLPLRAFNIDGDFNDRILGFNLAEGPDPDFFDERNPYYIAEAKAGGGELSDQRYRDYVQDVLKATGEFPLLLHPHNAGKINYVKPGFAGTTILATAGYLINSFLGDSSLSDVRGIKREEFVIDLYSYHIGTFDFTPHPRLLEFCLAKARIRTQQALGLPVDDL
ncbi:MAG: putative acylesterase/phospholipase RssA [Granulosicoccus sp.]|jgi:predicted acylesterase/phospholipase RssA